MGSFLLFKKLRNWDAFCQLKSKKNAEKNFYFLFFYFLRYVFAPQKKLLRNLHPNLFLKNFIHYVKLELETQVSLLVGEQKLGLLRWAKVPHFINNTSEEKKSWGNLVTNSRACKCPRMLVREDYPPRIWLSYPSPPSRKFQR